MSYELSALAPARVELREDRVSEPPQAQERQHCVRIGSDAGKSKHDQSGGRPNHASASAPALIAKGFALGLKRHILGRGDVGDALQRASFQMVS
jgi:hypothetical protein